MPNDEKIKRPDRREYERKKVALAFDFAPHIYACAKCGWPVAEGYCCTTCGDSNPSVDEQIAAAPSR